MQVYASKTEHEWHKENFKAILYVSKDLDSPDLLDEIIINKPIAPIDSPKNPGEFNFHQYWKNKNIVGQAFIKNPSELKVFNSHTSFLEQVRTAIKHNIDTYISNPASSSLIGTLFTGDKTLMDYDTRKSFSATGSVHILAVSGLHLGVIFMFTSFLLGFLKHHPFGKYFYLLAILTIIWFYALLTGLSPSIFRAAIMFSVFTFAGVFWLRSTTLNNTFLAAFIILLIDVKAIYDPGFQFSFSAVLGIVILYRPLYSKLSFRNKIVDYCWLMSCISIAAQLTTFPLVIYYFHQFPVYFLLSNILLIPLAAILLYGGVVWLSLSSIPLLASILGSTIEFVAWVMIQIVSFIQHLPGSLITDIRLSLSELVLLYLIIILTTHAFLTRYVIPLRTAFLCSLVLFCSKLFTFYTETHQKKLIVYHIPFHSGIDIIKGKKSYLIQDNWKGSETKINDFTIQPSHILHGLVNNETVPFQDLKTWNGIKLLKLKNKTIAIIDTNWNPLTFKNKIKPEIDILIVNNNCKFKQFTNTFNINQIIVDGSNYIGNIPEYHYTHHRAYQINLLNGQL